MAIGIGYDEFWTLNPRKLNVIMDGYRLRRQVKDEEMWLFGEYVFDAVTLALRNAFRKKGQKPKGYFEEVKEPLLKRIENTKTEELSEAEKRTKTELFFKNLEIMAANYNIQHGK